MTGANEKQRLYFSQNIFCRLLTTTSVSLLALFTLNFQVGELENTVLPKLIWLIWISPPHLYFIDSEPFKSPFLRDRHWELITRELGQVKKAVIWKGPWEVWRRPPFCPFPSFKDMGYGTMCSALMVGWGSRHMGLPGEPVGEDFRRSERCGFVGWVVSPHSCWSPNPHCLRMWPRLEIRLFLI